MPVEIQQYSRIGPGESQISNVLHANRLGYAELAIGAEVKSAEFDPNCGMVYVTNNDTVAARIMFGPNPTASNSAPKSQLLLPGREYGFIIPRNERYKASVIAAS